MLKWFSMQMSLVEVKPGPRYVDHMRWILLRISLQAALAISAGFVYDFCSTDAVVTALACACEVKKWRLGVRDVTCCLLFFAVSVAWLSGLQVLWSQSSPSKALSKHPEGQPMRP